MAPKLSVLQWGALSLVFLLLFLLAGGAWWENHERSRQPQGPFTKGGVSLERISRERDAKRLAAGSPELGSLMEEWELRSAAASVVVGSGGFGFVKRPNHGHLREALVPGARSNGVESISTLLFAGGRELELVVDSVAPRLDGATPFLIVAAHSARPRFDVTTHLKLDPEKAELRLTSSVVNRESSAMTGVRLGDRIKWPGGPPFIPRKGLVDTEGRVRGSFIGRAREGLSYALLYPERDALFQLLVDRVGPTQQLALDDEAELEPGERATFSRVLVMSPRGLAEPYARLLELQGIPTGTLTGRVEPSPLSRATIEVKNPAGQLIISQELHDDSQFEFQLSRGPYDVTLKAPGGDHTERVRIAPATRQSLTLLAPPAGTLRLLVTNPLGVPSPARVTLYGRHPTPKPYLGGQQRASGLENVAYTDNGDLNVELPTGQYSVRVTRGPEFSVYEKNVQITAGRGQSLALTLERVIETRGWISCDFHLHQAPSPDSSVTLEDRVTALAAEGVELAVATDHNHVTDLGPALRKRKLSTELSTIVGVEVTTVGWGHFNAFPFPETSRIPQYAGVVPWEIFADVRALAPSAVIQVNHPRLAGGIGYFSRLKWQGEALSALEEGFSFDFDTIEIVNGLELDKPEDLERNLKEWFSLLDLGRIFTAVGNSDSHSLAFQWAGYPRTYVKVERDVPGATSDDELSRALLRGRAQISNGIFADVRVADNGGPGDLVLAPDGEVLVEVAAQAPSWVDVNRGEIWVNGVLAFENKLIQSSRNKTHYTFSKKLKLERDAWIVVIVRGSRPLSKTFPEGKGLPFVIVNPVFVDVDGDQKFVARFAPPEPEPIADDPSLEQLGTSSLLLEGAPQTGQGGARLLEPNHPEAPEHTLHTHPHPHP